MSSIGQNVNVPMIPVIDELLAPSPTAPVEHKKKVQEYNDMLEDIYEREVELSKVKSHLLSMRSEIVEEAQIYGGAEAMQSAIAASAVFDININMNTCAGIGIATVTATGTGTGTGTAADDAGDSVNIDSDSGSGSDAAVLSDSAGSTGSSTSPYKKVNKQKLKIKGTMKSKGTGYRRSHVPEARHNASWDYLLDFGRGARRSFDFDEERL